MTRHLSPESLPGERPRGLPRILACSPRQGGNTDTAATLLRDAMIEKFIDADITRVADLLARPCVSCGSCAARPGQCSLDNALPTGEPDLALPLLRSLCAAPVACLVSPIYFYHLPAQAKALVDRAQAFWALPPGRKPGINRTLGVILLAARPRGEQLFAGTLLTLRYMADALGLTLADPLQLYGLDERNALLHNPDAQRKILTYGQKLAGL